MMKVLVFACAVVLTSAGSDKASVDMAIKKQMAKLLGTAIPTCEELCKKTNGYLPGLADPACRNCIPAGASATSGSVNAKTCMDKNCDELALARGAGMCPNDGFMECVAANTEVPALIQDLNLLQKSIADFANAGKGQLKGKRVSSDMAVRKQLVKQLAMYIPTCEEMCKKTNGYFPAESGIADPACRTCIPPGGNPLEGSETGSTCHEKNCDELALARGAAMCPNDGFMECVAANTAVPALLQAIGHVQEAITKFAAHP